MFVKEGEDGELEELIAEARSLTLSQFKEFANGGLEESIKATEATINPQ